MYQLLFIHSSSDGHWGCFHILAIVDDTAVSIDLLSNTHFVEGKIGALGD